MLAKFNMPGVDPPALVEEQSRTIEAIVQATQVQKVSERDKTMNGNKQTTGAYPVSKEWAERAFIDAKRYEAMYAASIANPEGFWGEHGKRIHWFKPYGTVKNTSFERGKVSIKWFEEGTTNVSYNCVDRHLPERGDQVAIIWEGTTRRMTPASPIANCTPMS